MKTFRKIAAYIVIVILTSGCMYTGAATAFSAVPTAAVVLVDGLSVAFRAYTVAGNNYFKLRDIAMALNGTEKQFDVEYDSATASIRLYGGRAYTPVGGELAAPEKSTDAVSAVPMTSNVYLNGAFITPAAFTIAGNNYFKLRDLGAAINFGVVWDGPANVIKIDTSTGYASEPGTEPAGALPVIVDHSCIRLDSIPVEWIEKAGADLHIAYGHTSHGSQLTTGLAGLAAFRGSPYLCLSGQPGALDLRDMPFGDGSPLDLGQPNNTAWAEATRAYLKNNTDVNVVMWSWCGQLSSAGEAYVSKYLSLMEALEAEYPGVVFVYMTGHLDGSGEAGNLARNNNIIREFCKSHGKVLYDFADIESYDPDGSYFGDKYATDACDYDSDGDKTPDRNWATDWQNAHSRGVDWYDCEAAHSQPVNANMKAYAAWWLMARLAGWPGEPA